MKKLFPLSVLWLFFMASSSFSQGPHNVIFFNEDGETFTIYINGVQQNDVPASNVKVEDLKGTGYQLRVLFENAVPGEFKKNMPLAEGSTEMTFALRKNKKGAWVARFVSESAYPAKATPALVQKPRQANKPANTGNQNQEIITTTTTTTITDEGMGASEGMDVSVKIGDQTFGMDVKIDDPTATRQTTTVTTQTVTTQSDFPTSEIAETAEEVSAEGCTGPMANADFNRAKESISSKTFEDSKLKIAMQITRGNCLSAMQVKQIMQLFTYEESRLEFAKFAHEYTFDKQNYYQVNDAFQFELTIDELDEFLNR